MKYFYKIEKEGKLRQIGAQSFPADAGTGQTQIGESEYNALLAKIKAHTDIVREHSVQVLSGEMAWEDIPDECCEEVGSMVVGQLARRVHAGEMKIEDVPEKLKDKVNEEISNLPNNPYGIPNEEWDRIQKEVEQKAVNKAVAIANGTYMDGNICEHGAHDKIVT
ncbi:hypothetical protein [Senimuribacter intestinalis]|jgi:hypothetical protein|uniref:hypothetical protein n=1 Tax=Senimuribacter intestinalis TaxID=2941507 RepID=UPI00203E9A65|nr:hypothetical protein [Senimuribacter intestinalis]